MIAEAKENSDKHKEEVKINVQAKVPELNKATEGFVDEISKPEYLAVESNTADMVIKVNLRESEMTTLVKRKELIQEYQKTLDMGDITMFSNVEDARLAHKYRHQMWHALNNWADMKQKWETDSFQNIKKEII